MIRGRLAFVLNWNEDNGGYFELLENDWNTVRLKIIPTFNSLTVFNVEGDGVPHRVTKIRSDVTDCRIAFGGWLC